MKDVRAVLMYENSVFVVMIVGVAADMRPLVADQDLLVRSSGQTFSQHAARETGSND